MLEVNVEDFDEMNTFIKEEKDLFFTNLIICIEKGWEEKLELVNIARFHIRNDDKIVSITIENDDWFETLHLALYHFEEVENYEYCLEITELINKIFPDDD